MSDHARAPRSLVSKLALLLCGLMLLVVVGAAIYLAKYGSSQQGQKEQAQAGQVKEQEQKKDLATQVAEACAGGGVVAKNLTQRGLCGKAQQIIKEPIQGKQGEAGKEGKQGPPPSDEQVQRAVDAFCANGRCNGKSPTPQQVALAVAAYCNARGQCTPPKPKDGKDGEPGQNATSDQVAAAVASFCADDNCDGEDGKDGKDGANGTNGRSVTITTFPIDGVPPGTRVVVSYSDDTPSVAFNIFDGKDGEPGKVGPAGPAVKSWTWTDTLGQQYTCTDPDGDLNYACENTTPTTTPTSGVKR